MTVNINSKKTLYAVYGTLRKGCGNHHVINKPNVEFVGHCITEPKYTMYDVGAFPALKKGGNQTVLLEIYSVDDLKVESALDALEGYSPDRDPEHNMYIKEIIDTPFGPSYVYIWNYRTNDMNVVESGDWVHYSKLEDY